MATNVTEKDKTLQAIIDYCDSQAEKLGAEKDADYYANFQRICAYYDVARYCEKRLGYSGNMPNEVPNQSEK